MLSSLMISLTNRKVFALILQYSDNSDNSVCQQVLPDDLTLSEVCFPIPLTKPSSLNHVISQPANNPLCYMASDCATLLNLGICKEQI